MSTNGPALQTDDEYSSLVESVNRDYRIVTENISIGDFVIQFTRVSDPDSMLEEMEANATSDGVVEPCDQPYWAQAWESALAVSEELASRDCASLNALDLGCGLGLTGAVAAARGANVLMADASPPSLLFARLNSWPWRKQVRTRQVNWRTDNLHEQFHLIIGSEILYDRLDWPYLDRFWKAHLAPTGRVLLAEPGRFFGDEFLDWIEKESNWLVSLSSRKVHGENRPIRLIELTIPRE